VNVIELVTTKPRPDAEMIGWRT